MRRGFTLIELLTALALSGFLLIAISLAFSVATRASTSLNAPRERFEAVQRFEDRVRALIEEAYVSSDENDRNTFFIGRAVNPQLGEVDGADELIFTRLGSRAPAAVRSSDEEDFELRNESFGPQGGPVETALTMTPIGDGATNNGLFLRRQTPSDGDFEQGGFEETLNEQVESVAFEFWADNTWQPTWDTTNASGRVLPSAVRVSYRVLGDENLYQFVVRLTNAPRPAEVGQ